MGVVKTLDASVVEDTLGESVLEAISAGAGAAGIGTKGPLQ